MFVIYTIKETEQRRDVNGGHLQLLCWVFIWPEEPQLIDLVAFAEMRRHDFVSFFDPTAKHGDVGHHSSVVVEIGVKHEGFEWVVSTCHRPENTGVERKKEKKKKLHFCVSDMFHGKNDPKWTFVRWDSFHNCLKNLVDIGSQFCRNLKKKMRAERFREKPGSNTERLKSSFQMLQLTRMHSSRGISNTLSICASTLSGSAFFRSIWERHEKIRENNWTTQQPHVGVGVPCWWWGWLPAELQKPGRSWPPSVPEPPSQDHKRLLTSSTSIHHNAHNYNNKGQLGAKNRLLYLIGIDNQKDALACRNRSGYFITEVNMTLKKQGRERQSCSTWN